jgi:DNA adenine methylase
LFFFDVEPKKAILGDINAELVTAYKALKKNPALVLKHLKAIPKGKREYYSQRARSLDELTEAQIAARFIYLNKYSSDSFSRLTRDGGRGH